MPTSFVSVEANLPELPPTCDSSAGGSRPAPATLRGPPTLTYEADTPKRLSSDEECLHHPKVTLVLSERCPPMPFSWCETCLPFLHSSSPPPQPFLKNFFLFTIIPFSYHYLLLCRYLPFSPWMGRWRVWPLRAARGDGCDLAVDRGVRRVHHVVLTCLTIKGSTLWAECLNHVPRCRAGVGFLPKKGERARIDAVLSLGEGRGEDFSLVHVKCYVERLAIAVCA